MAESIDEPRRKKDEASEQVTTSSDQVIRERDYFGNIVLTDDEAAKVEEVSRSNLIVNMSRTQG